MKDEVLPHARDPFQRQDLQLVAPRRGCWYEGLRRESDHFRKALWGKERDIRKCSEFHEEVRLENHVTAISRDRELVGCAGNIPRRITAIKILGQRLGIV